MDYTNASRHMGATVEFPYDGKKKTGVIEGFHAAHRGLVVLIKFEVKEKGKIRTIRGWHPADAVTVR